MANFVLPNLQSSSSVDHITLTKMGNSLLKIIIRNQKNICKNLKLLNVVVLNILITQFLLIFL